MDKNEKQEMNWQFAHALLLVSRRAFEVALEAGDPPEPKDFLVAMTIAIKSLNNEYDSDELCEMMATLALTSKLQNTTSKAEARAKAKSVVEDELSKHSKH